MINENGVFKRAFKLKVFGFMVYELKLSLLFMLILSLTPLKYVIIETMQESCNIEMQDGVLHD